MKTLHLTVTKQWFELMVTGEKKSEFREPSEWIMSRLFDVKNNCDKPYDLVKITNGYGNNKPSFTAKYNGYFKNKYKYKVHYSNGAFVIVKFKDIVIGLGEIIEIKNYETNNN